MQAHLSNSGEFFLFRGCLREHVATTQAQASSDAAHLITWRPHRLKQGQHAQMLLT